METTNNQATAYTSCNNAFLNSSGFHLAITNLVHINMKTQTTNTPNIQKIVSLKNESNPSKVDECTAVSALGNISDCRDDANTLILVKNTSKENIIFFIIFI